MEPKAADTITTVRRTPGALARLLSRLFDERFGGASSGRFRISRKFLRALAGRRKLPDAYLAAVAEEMFEAGFVFVDCESFSIVLSQKQFTSYRRVTANAVDRLRSDGNAFGEPEPGRGQESGSPDAAEIEERVVQRGPNIH